MAYEPTADDGGGATDGKPRVHSLQTYFRVFQNPDLSCVYYRARDGPVTVPELREELGLSKSSAYNYIDELVDAGLLVELEEAQGATQYSATDWTLTIEIDGDSLSLGPLTALVLANKTQYPAINRVVDEHGLETLQNCITEARVYDRGETTTRQFAADTDLSYGLAFEVLNAIAQLFGFESEDEPLTSADAPDDTAVDSEVDLAELEGGREPSGDEDDGTAPIGLMERKRQSDEE
jgi:DNA-binding Lrp family transcriptional regulator